MEKKYSVERHQYNNEVFGMNLIISNLTHTIQYSAASAEEKAECKEYLDLLSGQVVAVKALFDSVTIS